MAVPAEIGTLLHQQQRALSGLAPEYRRKLREIGRETAARLQRELAEAVPGSFKESQAIRNVTGIFAVINSVSAYSGEAMGDVVEELGRESSRVGRLFLGRQMDVWAHAGVQVPNFEGAGDVLADGLLEHYQVSRARWTAQQREAMHASMAQSILANETLAETFERMASDVSIADYEAERIVRTETSNAAHRRQLQDMREAAGDDDRWRKQLVTLFDDRTGTDSILIHEQTRKLDEKFERANGDEFFHPPDRPNDRGTMVFVPVDPPEELETTPPPSPGLFGGAEAQTAQAALEKLGQGGRIGTKQKKAVRNTVRDFVGDELPQQAGAWKVARGKLNVQRDGSRAAATMHPDGTMTIQRAYAEGAARAMGGSVDAFDLEGFEALVHEEIHDRGVSAIWGSAVRTKLEEVSTETLARELVARKMREQVIGTNPASTDDDRTVARWRTAGAYQIYREQVRSALRKAAADVGVLPTFKGADALVNEKLWLDDLIVKGARGMKGKADDLSEGWLDRVIRQQNGRLRFDQMPAFKAAQRRSAERCLMRFVGGLPKNLRDAAEKELRRKL